MDDTAAHVVTAKAKVEEPAPEPPPVVEEAPVEEKKKFARNPFKTFIDSGKAALPPGSCEGGDCPPVKPDSDLECCPLSQFNIAVVISGGDDPDDSTALVITPAGKRWKVKVGDKIGNMSGKIISMGRGVVVVRENRYDIVGEFIETEDVTIGRR